MTRLVFYYSTAPQLEDAEHWFGPFLSRQSAGERCRTRFPDVGYWTAEGTAQLHRLDPSDTSMAEPGGAIASAFEQVNSDLIGDGGEGGPWEWTNEAVASLVQRLNAQFAQWAQAHGYQRGWALDLTGEEWTLAPTVSPAETRERPLLSLIGGGRS